MTDREILERAAVIVEREGANVTAGALRHIALNLPSTAPTDTVAVRIAVGFSFGRYFAVPIYPKDIPRRRIYSDRDAIMEIRENAGSSDGLEAEAILAARIPRREIPVVEATVESFQ